MLKPRVSVVIVNYNSGDQLPRCLNSLRSQTCPHLEVIVVDNASKDGSLDHLERFPEVRVIPNSVNRGFAAAQNQGWAAAKGDYFLALNFDLVAADTFVERLVAALEADPTAGWACGKLLNMAPDGTLMDTVYATGHQLPADRFPVLRGCGERDRGQYDRLEYVFGAPGAAALYKRQMVDDVAFEGQFFDESFFTWYEDVDVDWRAQNRGWKCLYVPTAVAYHEGHVLDVYQEPFRSFRARLTIRNRWLMVLSNEVRVSNHEILRYELLLLRYVLRSRLTRAYLGAVASSLHLSPRCLRKRRHTLRTPPTSVCSSSVGTSP